MLRPVAEAILRPEDIRRAKRVDRAITQDGRVRNEPAYSSAWDGYPHLMIGTRHLWIDATGDLRIKAGHPTSDTDGVVVGTQT
jgi:hypothetical protein